LISGGKEMCVSYKKRSPEELENILKDYREGIKYLEISKKYKIGESSFYRIVKAYHGMNAAEIKKLRSQDKEMRRLQVKLEEQAFEIKLLKKALKKKW
jgi:putative transposase